MATQSVSGNRDSASTLESSLSKLDKLTSDYESDLSDIQTRLSGLESAIIHVGCSTCIKQLEYLDDFVRWFATYIKADIPEIVDVKREINSLLIEIDSFQEQYETLKGTSKDLETLADQLKNYQNEINKALSNDKIKQAAVSSMAATFASNKYDAKNGDYIPKEKVSTASDSWEGDLKFVRQDNGTYLVIKVGKDGSEVPMGYTTRKGKNAYYKKAKAEVLKNLKGNNTSSNENNTSSKEETTSDSNSKSDSNSGDYVEASDINKSIKPIFRERMTKVGLTDAEKAKVSKNLANDLKKDNLTKTDLKDCDYVYRTTIKDGKKIIYVEAMKYVKDTGADTNGSKKIVLTNKSYELW
mgnify:CR=1 FL=1